MTKVDRIARLGERLAQSKFRAETDHILNVVRGVEPVHAGLAVEVERASGDKRAPNGETYHVRIKASTESIARDKGIIPMRAWQDGGLRNFTDNPIILAFHDHKQPIGRSVHTEIDGNALVEYWEFHLESEISRTMHKLYDRGFMRAASVGFLIKEFSFVDELGDKDLEKLVEKYGAAAVRDLYWIAERAELLETSAVPVPSDANALTFDFAIDNARAIGIDVSSLRTSPTTGDTMTDAEKAAKEKSDREAAETAAREAAEAPFKALTALVEKSFKALNDELAALRALVEKKPEAAPAPAAAEAARTAPPADNANGVEITIEKKAGETDEQALDRHVEEMVARLRGAPLPTSK